MNSLATNRNGAQIHMAARRKRAPGAVTFSSAMAMLYRQRWAAILCIAGALLIGLLVTLMTSPRYVSQASVQLEQNTPTIIPGDSLEPEIAVQESERFLQTQIDRILSQTTADGVARRLNIASNAGLLAALGLEEGPAAVTRQQIAAALQENVSTALGLNTRIAQISFVSFDRDASAQIANAYAEEISSSNLVDRTSTAARAQDYLADELADARVKLEESERAMLNYARNADLTTTVVPTSGDGAENGGSLRAQQLGQLNNSLAQATAERIEAEQQWRQVANTAPMALPEVQNNDAVQELISQRAELDAQVAEQSQRYTSEYPGVASLTAKRGEIDTQISQLGRDIKQSYRDRYNAAQRAEQQMRGMVDGLRSSAMAERERSVGYNALQREVDSNRAFYDGLLERYQQIAAASGAPGENIQVVDRAQPAETAVSPDPLKNMALAGLLGAIAALGVGFLRENSSNVVRSPADAERHLDVKALGAIPIFDRKANQDSVILDPRSPQSEAYYSAAVALYKMNGEKRVRRALITSSTPGEGKSTSSVAIARSLASIGKRVVLVDGDLRRPSLGMMLGQPIGAGLADLLASDVGLDNALCTPEGMGFSLITSGDVDGDPVTFLSSERMGHLMNELDQRFDVVLIDGPPIMGIADSVILADQVEAVAVVIEANNKDVEELEASLARLPADLPIGAIVTKFDARIAGVKFGRQSYYSY